MILKTLFFYLETGTTYLMSFQSDLSLDPHFILHLC